MKESIQKYDYEESLTRSLDLLPISALSKSITIIGAGAVGSWTTLALAKMGFQNITVLDFDKVETVNVGTQLFRFKDIGKMKVKALKEIVEDFTNISIFDIDKEYEGAMLTSDIVISAVDNMKVRSLIWDKNKEIGFVKHIIDPRMGAEVAALYVMNATNTKDITSYEKTLYTDDTAVFEPCTRKATAYCAMALSGLICSQVKALATNNNYSRITHWDMPSGGFNSWGNV